MYKKGTTILIPFPFTDLSHTKIRPAVIVSNITTGDGVVTAFISSNPSKKVNKTDIIIKESDRVFKQSGLKTNSVIKVSKVATLDKKIILGELGKLDKKIISEIDKKIKILFGL